MAPARHNTRLSTVREMDDAFDDDDNDDQQESTPLRHFHRQSSISMAPLLFRGETDAARPNAYDFEREYDFPPPGSPPSPSTSALPNDYGNSNGHLPTSPVIRSSPQSIFRRTFGAILPQSYYQRVPSDARPRGGGTDNDGVFANVTAKPAPPVSVRTDNGDVYIAPEETQQEAPPSYMAASADAAPSYWDTIVHAPTGVDLNGDMIIEELPTGSVLVFVLTTLISWFFQLPGFILSYLLHTTHAGRFGSQAGLALTLIQWGFGSTVMGPLPPPDEPPPPGPGPGGPPPGGGLPVGGGNPEDGMMGNSTMMDGNDSALADMQIPYSGHEWISFFLMTIGWFLLLTSLLGYFRVKRFELSVRASRASPSSSSSSAMSAAENDVDRDVMLRRNFEGVFAGVSVVFNSNLVAAAASANPTPNHTSDRAHQNGAIFRAIEEARLQNDLRNAGLL